MRRLLIIFLLAFLSIGAYSRINNTYGRKEVAWDDIRVDVNALRINPTSSKPDYAADGEFRTYLFDAATPESLFFRIQLPHDYKIGSDLYPHVHWANTNANAGNVQWKIRYSIADGGETFSASDTISIVDVCLGDNVHNVAHFRSISGSSITGLSAMIKIVLYRVAAAEGDTYDSDAAIEEFDIHYQRDGLGSRWELVK